MTIRVMQPRLPNLTRAAGRLRAVHERMLYSNFGPEVIELEHRFAERLGVEREQVVSASNATLGLTGAVVVSAASDWVVPSFTFPASVSAALVGGGRVVLHDIHPDSWWLDADEVGRGEGIIAVAPFGAAVDLTRYQGREEVVIDAAASLGTEPNLRDLPSTWAVVFSLHATKVLGAGEGAIAVFGDVERARRFRTWSNFGFHGTRESQFVGLNAKMSEFQAAYAHAALDDWEQERAEWEASRDLVVRAGDAVGLVTFAASRSGITPYWIVVLPDAAATNRLAVELDGHGIGHRRWWSRGCHRMPGFEHVDRRPLPVTEDVADRYLGLPMYRRMSEADVERIALALAKVRR